ncbi:MAG: LysR family transcriptional regulator [Rhizobiaceae bacterium]|jgi:DNA-binding transcriptional LysR family regulator|nr:LysR family transcriptional regulator [Rhizobiaceae bacterium]
MHLDLPLLKSFIAIVDEGNFLKAAEAVGRSPAAISVHINKLEDALGVTLFDRDARATRLTRRGEELVQHARRMLALEASIYTQFRDEPIQGTVRLGVPDDVIERFPMPMLTNFSNDYPGVSLALHVDHTASLLRAVDNGSLDLSVITYAESIPGVAETEILMREPEIWASAANGIAIEKTPIPVVLWEKQWAWYQSAVDILQVSGFEYSIILECENVTARKRAIRADLAIGPLPVSEMDSSLIVAPGFDKLPPLPHYGLGLKMQNNPTPVAKAVAKELREHFA